MATILRLTSAQATRLRSALWGPSASDPVLAEVYEMLDEAAEGVRRDRDGNAITLGATVQVMHVDAGRGAQRWMERGEVVGFGTSRVLVQFPSRGKAQAVGDECLVVIR